MNNGRQHTAPTTPSRSAFRSTEYIAQNTAEMPVPSSRRTDTISIDPLCVSDCIIIATTPIRSRSVLHKHRTRLLPTLPAKGRDQIFQTYSRIFPTGNNRSTNTSSNNPISNQGIYQPPTANTSSHKHELSLDRHERLAVDAGPQPAVNTYLYEVVRSEHPGKNLRSFLQANCQPHAQFIPTPPQIFLNPYQPEQISLSSKKKKKKAKYETNSTNLRHTQDTICNIHPHHPHALHAQYQWQTCFENVETPTRANLRSGHDSHPPIYSS